MDNLTYKEALEIARATGGFSLGELNLLTEEELEDVIDAAYETYENTSAA